MQDDAVVIFRQISSWRSLTSQATKTPTESSTAEDTPDDSFMSHYLVTEASWAMSLIVGTPADDTGGSSLDIIPVNTVGRPVSPTPYLSFG